MLHPKTLPLFTFIAIHLLAISSEAAGPKPPTPTDPVFKTPNPKRTVLWRGVSSPHFVLPNGQSFSISNELSGHLQTQVIQSGLFDVLPTGGAAEEDACGESLQLSASLSNFELEASRFKVRFGYTPAGSLWGGITQLSGSVDVQLNVAVMDVVLSKCKQGVCKGIAAGYAKTNPATVNTQMQIDFSQIVLGVDFLYKTPLAQWLSTLMNDALKNLKQNESNWNQVPWEAQVLSVDGKKGGVAVNVGSNSGIHSGETFWILKKQDSTACSTYLPVAQGVSTSEITPVSSFIQITQSTSNEVPGVGDAVMIRAITGNE